MPKTLLLADDSVTIRKVVGISFANEDVTLVTVDNGDDALARAREIRPDIVLADVVMPGMNGYEVCEAIKSDPQLRHTPVLLLTGTFEAFDEERAARAGADGHITKPFEARALVEQVNTRLAQAGAPEPAPIMESPTPRPAKLALEDALELGSAPAASSERGSSFDFFDDEVTAPRSGSAPRPSEETMVIAGDLEVGGQEEDAFAFESTDDLDEELSAAFRASPEPQREVPTATLEVMGEPDLTPERTAAFVPDDDAFTSALTEPPDQAPALGESDLAGFEPDHPFPIQTAASSFQDFTSSLPDEPAPTRVIEETAALDAHLDRMSRPLSGFPDETLILSDLDTDPLAELMASDSPDAPAAGEGPAADPLAAMDSGDLAAEAILDPVGGRDYDVSSSDLGDPLLEAARTPEPAENEPAWETELPALAEDDIFPEPGTGETPGPAPHPLTAPPEAAPELSPLARGQLHDALEKIAWEAFSDATEQIVKQALERIERVAWEVIPQMAEALIREEIRRLKGEDE